MTEEPNEPTNAELRYTLLSYAADLTLRHRSKNLHAAWERINDLTEALKELHLKTVIGSDSERHDALDRAWAVIYRAEPTPA